MEIVTERYKIVITDLPDLGIDQNGKALFFNLEVWINSNNSKGNNVFIEFEDLNSLQVDDLNGFKNLLAEWHISESRILKSGLYNSNSPCLQTTLKYNGIAEVGKYERLYVLREYVKRLRISADTLIFLECCHFIRANL